ncbi:MAG: kynureninase [Pseudomonadota bacterium]
METIDKLEWDLRASALDQADPLAPLRRHFDLPVNTIYMDGNSLGPLPGAVKERMRQTVDEEWGDHLIRSWNDADWVNLPQSVGEKIAPLIGAPVGSVIASDSTSINLFKVLSAAIDQQPGRQKIISERANFPTDLYMAQGLAAFLGQGHQLVLLDDPDDLDTVLDDDVAVVMLTHVNYRTGRMLDMKTMTAKAQNVGALTIWDLAHSAGAVPVDLTDAHADFAIGCGYKFLNGGPGAPAFIYVAPDHQAGFAQPLTGWFGHAKPFAFETDYRPAWGIERALCGTPNILSLSALDTAMSLWGDVSMAHVRAKSLALGDLFIATVEANAEPGALTLVTPRDHGERGSQVSFAANDGGYAMMQCLISHGIVGDFRPPDILRFGITPLYMRFTDVLRAAQRLADIVNSREWDQPHFHEQRTVT